ncbi:NUDIX domain-containing protein [Romboutsia maritimum]|uniref:NUDIX domain-containing protein n=1 Tax=Romboutsia maritimum TaxID=2020948 RepID=A0A371IRG3_9FIRM|nr:NUDIX domain-containing protein [Romboutsia maritimum]RDY23065.1 NUDIX domain-containing protein [Romboutsia maritimum]
MILRHCAGGVVFYANKVLLLKNDRNEWTLPQGRITDGGLPNDSAVLTVKEETGIDANVIEVAGDTMYEFFSRTRQKQVTNAIIWYIMDTKDTNYILKDEFIDGGFYKVKDALDMLTHNKEKSLVEISYKKYKDLKKKSLEGEMSI